MTEPVEVTQADNAYAGYPDCQFCNGRGFFTVIASRTLKPGDRIRCNNCYDRWIDEIATEAKDQTND